MKTVYVRECVCLYINFILSINNCSLGFTKYLITLNGSHTKLNNSVSAVDCHALRMRADRVPCQLRNKELCKV